MLNNTLTKRKRLFSIIIIFDLLICQSVNPQSWWSFDKVSNNATVDHVSQIKDEIQSNIYESGLINYGSYHINPLKFLLGIANQINSTKIKVFENTPITKIIEHEDSMYCYSNLKKIKSKKVIVGCNGYLDNLLSNIRKRFILVGAVRKLFQR